MSDEQSTAKFLFSKEGRGILIGTIALVVVAIIIGVYTYGVLFGGSEPANAQANPNAPRAGESQIRAQTQNLSADITSQNLSEEARNVLDEYNDQAEGLGVMPVPTPANVTMVPVAASLPQAEESEIVAAALPGLNDTADNQRKAQNQNLNNRAPATPEQARTAGQMLQDYRRARLDAASQVLAIYEQPPSNASMSFARSANNATGDAPRSAGYVRSSDGSIQFDSGEGTASGMCESPLITGGEIRYAQTDIALNTDFRGPVRMTFLDGKIAGYTGMGSFELNEFGAMMKLRINTLFDPDGQRYQVSGYVLDPDTTLWAMRSDVDYHIIYRYGGFGLGTVLSAFSILADNRAQESEIVTPDGTQSTVYRDPDGKQVTWTVLGEFSRLFEEAFRDNINRPITVTLDPNEEAGVLFEDTVCELDTDISKKRKEAQMRADLGLTDPVMSR